MNATFYLLIILALLLAGCAQITPIQYSPATPTRAEVIIPTSESILPRGETLKTEAPNLFSTPGDESPRASGIPPRSLPPKFTPLPSVAISTPVPGVTPGAGGAKSIETMVQTAIADLAPRLGIDASQVQLIKTYADEFPAGDLGCGAGTPLPQPALVSGQVILLSADNVTYEYHVHGNLLIYCEK